MKRREFLKKAGVVAAASATLNPNVFAQGKGIQLEMVTSWPTILDTVYGGATNTADYIEEMTGGDITIKVYPAGVKVGGLDVFDAVSSGAFQMGHTASSYYVNKDPAHAFFTAIPFGLNVGQQDAWLLAGGGQELWNTLNKEYNMVAFLAGNTGVQMGGWFRKEITSVDDLQGLKMRISGLGAKVMERAGVNVQVLPAGKISSALDAGALEATEWIGPYDDEKLGLQHAATYYYAPGWQEPGTTLGLYINLDAWNSWDSDVQTIIQEAAYAANQQMIADYDARNGIAYTRLLERGAQPRTFPHEMLITLEGYMEEIHQESIATSEHYANIYENWVAFRDEIRNFHRVQENAWHAYIYSDSRAAAFGASDAESAEGETSEEISEDRG